MVDFFPKKGIDKYPAWAIYFIGQEPGMPQFFWFVKS
jgi:hypothetical protein